MSESTHTKPHATSQRKSVCQLLSPTRSRHPAALPPSRLKAHTAHTLNLSRLLLLLSVCLTVSWQACTVDAHQHKDGAVLLDSDSEGSTRDHDHDAAPGAELPSITAGASEDIVEPRVTRSSREGEVPESGADPDGCDPFSVTASIHILRCAISGPDVRVVMGCLAAAAGRGRGCDSGAACDCDCDCDSESGCGRPEPSRRRIRRLRLQQRAVSRARGGAVLSFVRS